MPMPRITSPHDVPHGMVGATETRGLQGHEGGGSTIAPASLTSVEVFGFTSGQQGASFSASPLRVRTPSPRATVPSAGALSPAFNDGMSGTFHRRDTMRGEVELAPSDTASDARDGSTSGSHSASATASTSAATAATMAMLENRDLGALLQDIDNYHLLHYGLRHPDDPWESAGPATPTVASPAPQPGTSTADALRETGERISLDAVLAQKSMAIGVGQRYFFRDRTPVLEFHGEKLPTKKLPQKGVDQRDRDLSAVTENRVYVAQQVASILGRHGYRLNYTETSPSFMLSVTEESSGKRFRVFPRLGAKDSSTAPSGKQVMDSGVVALVTIDPGDGRTLKSLYLTPLIL